MIEQVVIEKAVTSDIDRLKAIADIHRTELGFVRKPALLEAIDRSEVFIAKYNQSIIGFLKYHHRQDKQTTLYTIVVMTEYRRQGIGKALIGALIEDARILNKYFILLKCPVDLKANQFYKALEFSLDDIQLGKHRRLNIWRYSFEDQDL